MGFDAYREEVAPLVERALEEVLPAADTEPGRLHEAMRYSVFAGGKRVRPLLVLAIGESLGASRVDLLAPAAALELIHTFSLVHDDLPALDDDDLRRGRPTVHKVWDEALAILVGDALLGLGLEVLATSPVTASAATRLGNVADVCRAVGSRGMIGGQVDDLAAEGDWPDDPPAALESIHRRKTGALIAASLTVGARLAGADDEGLDLAAQLGAAAGLLFQIRDDLLDLEADAATLGKTPGKDQASHKLTYPALFGEAAARRLQQETHRRALDLESRLRLSGGVLRSLIDYLVARDR
ncbi:MAG: polyprenyl synthetase family protein [Acidobacteria bacterium]|nr:MAG: polyprenyl synthetase family protein [Acidobacteriota bacterium]REK10163.1 MAG: polyprenyl synthetase family protein [Acidobacteriota bacterium]